MRLFAFIILTMLLPAAASAFCFEEAGNEYGVVLPRQRLSLCKIRQTLLGAKWE